MEKNIAELIKDCPKGTKLYSPIFGNCTFEEIINSEFIIIKTEKDEPRTFDVFGRYFVRFPNGECMLFPSKENRDWSTFQKPFQDGDIVATKNGTWIGITTGGDSEKFIPTYCVIGSNGKFEAYFDYKEKWVFSRLATEEEKQKLFDTIKANGYKWNSETKTLEKLIEPKFKVGDKVLWNYDKEIPRTISKVELSSKRGYVYWIDCKGCSSGWWEETELTPISNKFDIATLKPYEEEIMEERKYTDLRLDVDQDDKLATEATIDGDKIIPPKNYLIGKITRVDNGMLVEFVKKQPKYPKTYKECCDVIGCDSKMVLDTMPVRYNILVKLEKLLICRNAYWKIAGGWTLDYDADELFFISNERGYIVKVKGTTDYNTILAFPTEEMRDFFYENFKELIEECKELL